MTPLSPAFFLLAVGLLAFIEATPIINSPTTLVQCQPAALTWSDATPPVYLSVSMTIIFVFSDMQCTNFIVPLCP